MGDRGKAGVRGQLVLDTLSRDTCRLAPRARSCPAVSVEPLVLLCSLMWRWSVLASGRVELPRYVVIVATGDDLSSWAGLVTVTAHPRALRLTITTTRCPRYDRCSRFAIQTRNTTVLPHIE